MLSDAFKELLTIEEGRLEAIHADCLPFAKEGDAEASGVHRHVVKEVGEILDLVRAFRAVNETDPDKQRAEMNKYKILSEKSMNLSAFLFSNSHCAGQFRNAVLQSHGAMMNTIAREQILTIVDLGWRIIEGMNARDKQKLAEQGIVLETSPEANTNQQGNKSPTRASHLRLVSTEQNISP